MGNTTSITGEGDNGSGHHDSTNVHEVSLSCPFYVKTIETQPIEGQKPGTSGLRKKTKVFMETPNYLENFVACTLKCVMEGSGSGNEPVSFPTTGRALLIGGDGRYYNQEAIQTIIKIGVAMGISRFWIGKDGLLSTPAISAVIRERGPQWQSPFGAFILTASHNPGGPDEDFGIKYNCSNGGPAPEGLTNAIYDETTKITSYPMATNMPDVKLDEVGSTIIWNEQMTRKVSIEVIDTTEDHVKLLKSIFDFSGIQKLLDRKDFTMVYDAMSGVNGPYAKAVFVDELGQEESKVLMNCEPKDDFGGGHADPNLTYAKQLVAKMGLNSKGEPIEVAEGESIPSFGAAADGDGDRNMILGTQFFVTPSDSLAVLAAQCTKCIPFFAEQGGLKAVARSMPTSGAVDLVAKANKLDLFETPTGWKYFGNLMDSKDIFNGTDYCPMLCGEESFGTGSNHVREKDGLWAVLAWLSILAFYNHDETKPLVTVEDILKQHWKTYGRNYYCRWDFENVSKEAATQMMEEMRSKTEENTGRTMGNYTIDIADDFCYTDPVDGFVASGQGLRFLMTDGSRIIFRLSGTAGSGATVRMYIEQYQSDETKLNLKVSEALEELIAVALELCNIKEFCGTDVPTVIT